eukprot:CAMPEP_0197433668 /NCGR_PEP_ID=MMETSP1175-20131217/1526_1 /TAXON_ID=1003142 /ORGANISM="Triceratium dubium, Strain CCMP147" /LENGTH=351 /DNA_ID=CAMNT_0042962133 /DNA_START=9 /DNA_END=1064 /DNA_ORIENTATION=+
MRTNTTSQRVRSLYAVVFAALAAIIAFPLQASAKKECIEIKPGNVKGLARDSHVLLKVGEKYPSGKDEDEYKDLCVRYEGTPTERTRDLVIGHFGIDVHGDKEAKKKALSIAEKFGAADEDEWPTYVLIRKGTTEASEAIKFEGEKTVVGVTTFIRDQLEISVGAMLYYIETLDKLVSRFMEVDENGDAKAQIVRHFYAYVAKIMIFLNRGEAKEVAQMYGKVFNHVMTEGKEYATKNIKRLEGMLGSGDRSMSNSKREEVAQRIHILEKFAKPVEVSAEDNRSFYFAVAWYVFLVGAMIVTIIGIFFFEEKGTTTDDTAEEKTGDVSNGTAEEDVDKEGEEKKTETKKDQ